MKIQQINNDRKRYLDILLLADPKKERIEEYLKQGKMFALSESGVICSVAVVVTEGHQCELKNIATIEEERGKGYGSYLLQYVCEHFGEFCDTMIVRMKNVAGDVRLYENCGFEVSEDQQLLEKHMKTTIDVKRIVDFALDAGKTLLESGAEIFRAEETITRICNRYHINEINLFTLSHAIFVTARTEKADVYTKVLNVPLPSTHLGKVTKVNALSREISAGGVSIEEAEMKLEEIKQTPPFSKPLQILGAGMGSGFLGYLLGGTITEASVAFVIGCILYVWLFAAQKNGVSKIIINIFGGVIITAIGLLAQKLYVVETLRLSGMMCGAVMPLVPGVPFTNAIRDIADSDYLSGTVRMIDAVLVFVYIATGVGCTLACYNMLIGGTVIW